MRNMEGKTRHGGKRPGAGTRNDARILSLDDETRQMLNALVARQRGVIGEKISHTDVVKDLIKAAWEREININEDAIDWQGEIL
jgi:hypothetical protein